MVHLKTYNLIQVFSILSLITIVYEYWGVGFISIVFMINPYIIVFLLANNKAYKTKLRVVCRAVGGTLVSILALGLLLYVKSDPQTGIGIGLAIVMQYGVIFVSEAIIGLATYDESSTHSC